MSAFENNPSVKRIRFLKMGFILGTSEQTKVILRLTITSIGLNSIYEIQYRMKLDTFF